MHTENFIKNKCENLSIPVSELERYNEPHRFYHNFEHICSMVENANKFGILTDDLFLSIVFHDIVYNPKRNDNEEESVNVLRKYISNENVEKAILETKTHNPSFELSKYLSHLDLEILKTDFKGFVEFEKNIFKEYQFVDYSVYKTERVKVLETLKVESSKIDYVNNRAVKIAVYPGSFNPFHKGHYDILKKAENVFDKVIIARGKNPDKQNELADLPTALEFHQVDNYEGLLTDYVSSKEYDLSIIRGLRNESDFSFEKTQYRFLKDLKPNVNVFFILSEPELEHISSSAIRQLYKFGADSKSYLP